MFHQFFQIYIATNQRVNSGGDWVFQLNLL